MPRTVLDTDVFNEAIDRMVKVYEEGHRVVVSFSAGKDSCVALEVTIIAAHLTGRLPVEVVMRDEEIMFPGTYEYAERTAERPEVDFHWLVANQPIINVFNRTQPYWWVFDPEVDPELWVRKPPSYAEYIPDQNIAAMTTLERFPPPPGKQLVDVIGLRATESGIRRAAIHSSSGYLTNPINGKVRCRPIYDWSDGDVWRAISTNKWDYNHAYNVMYRMNVGNRRMRIGPPTMTWYGAQGFAMARSAWPRWFDRVANRLPGVRTVAMFGKAAILPHRRLHETWRDCLIRECITDAPAAFIAERTQIAMRYYEEKHASHSTQPLPDVAPCRMCSSSTGSYKEIALAMYNGNPFSFKMDGILDYIEPEFFRQGAGTWGGKPTW